MVINDELIFYLEEISKLRLSQEEREQAKGDLGKILDYINKLDELDINESENDSIPFLFADNFRDDVVIPSFDRKAVMANAPCEKDGCFKVPMTKQ